MSGKRIALIRSDGGGVAGAGDMCRDIGGLFAGRGTPGAKHLAPGLGEARERPDHRQHRMPPALKAKFLKRGSIGTSASTTQAAWLVNARNGLAPGSSSNTPIAPRTSGISPLAKLYWMETGARQKRGAGFPAPPVSRDARKVSARP
ncbi:MAG: hypothetical protein Kow0013_07750 [Pararhodobacter sp.]